MMRWHIYFSNIIIWKPCIILMDISTFSLK